MSFRLRFRRVRTRGILWWTHPRSRRSSPAAGARFSVNVVQARTLNQDSAFRECGPIILQYGIRKPDPQSVAAASPASAFAMRSSRLVDLRGGAGGRAHSYGGHSSHTVGERGKRLLKWLCTRASCDRGREGRRSGPRARVLYQQQASKRGAAGQRRREHTA